jgi:biopolymer transport protein ExbD
MAALIDVVLLLLIFLLLAGTVAPPEPFPLEPPRSREASGGNPQADTVLLAADGRIAYGGRVISRTELVQVLATSVASASTPAVEVEADGALGAGSLLDVLEEIERAGAERVRLLVVEEPR